MLPSKLIGRVRTPFFKETGGVPRVIVRPIRIKFRPARLPKARC